MKTVSILLLAFLVSCSASYEVKGTRPLENRGWEDDDDLELVPVNRIKSNKQ